MNHPEYDNLLKRVSGSLKSAIDVHGPITLENRSSAAKRITSQIIAAVAQLEEQGCEPTERIL